MICSRGFFIPFIDKEKKTFHVTNGHDALANELIRIYSLDEKYEKSNCVNSPEFLIFCLGAIRVACGIEAEEIIYCKDFYTEEEIEKFLINSGFCGYKKVEWLIENAKYIPKELLFKRDFNKPINNLFF